MAAPLYDEWIKVVERGFLVDNGSLVRRRDHTEVELVDWIHARMVRRGWIPGPDDVKRAKPWTVERARDVLDALRGMHAAKEGLR